MKKTVYFIFQRCFNACCIGPPSMDMLRSGRHVYRFFKPEPNLESILKQRHHCAHHNGPFTTTLDVLAQAKLDPEVKSFISGCIKVGWVIF